MSELDRIKALAGLATGDVAEESVEREMKEQTINEGGCACCGCTDSCGCPADCPNCDCNRVDEAREFGPIMYRVKDENEQEYDIQKYGDKVVAMPSDPENLMGGGDGPYDFDEENCEIYGVGKCTKISTESKSSGDAWYAEQRAKEAYEKANPGKRWADLPYGYKEDWREKTESVESGEMLEAAGEFAEPFYKLQDQFCGGECPSAAHKALINELVNFLDRDEIDQFVAKFRAEYDMDETPDFDEDPSFQESEELAEEPNEGNKFTGEREKAIAAGEDEFEVDGKKYKVKEGSDLSVMANSMDKVERTYAEIVKAQPEQSEVGDYIGRGMTGDQIKKLIDMLEPQGYDKDYLMKDLAPMMEGGVEEEIVSEAPTMDTTQLVTLLKNAGLSEEAIKQKLDEWANTPEGVGEVEPTDHGEAYEMAQAVNLSLKKYLDAEDMKVTVKEHKSEDLTALYEEYKNTKK